LVRVGGKATAEQSGALGQTEITSMFVSLFAQGKLASIYWGPPANGRAGLAIFPALPNAAGMKTETWKPIPNHPGYEASDQGRVRNARTLRVWKPRRNREGYLRVNLPTGNGKERTRYVHQLVLEAFVGPMPKGGLTRHLDGKPANNARSNLRYGNLEENGADAVIHIRHRRGLTDDRMREVHLKHGIAAASGTESAERAATTVAEEFGVSLGYVMHALESSPDLVSDDERHIVRAYHRHAGRVLRALDEHQRKVALVQEQYQEMLTMTAQQVRVLARAREVRRLRAEGRTLRTIAKMVGVQHPQLIQEEKRLTAFEFLTIGFGTA